MCKRNAIPQGKLILVLPYNLCWHLQDVVSITKCVEEFNQQYKSSALTFNANYPALEFSPDSVEKLFSKAVDDVISVCISIVKHTNTILPSRYQSVFSSRPIRQVNVGTVADR